MSKNFLFSGLIELICLCVSGVAYADSPKGVWGRVVPIADDNHPNLYYNRREIDELRSMILVQKSPAELVNAYNQTRKFLADSPYENASPNHNNMRAAMSYMIEPTQAKADAIRTALVKFMSYFPNGLPGWYGSTGCYECGYSTPWLFDLIQAYHPNTLSASEKASLKSFFAKSAEKLKFNSRDCFVLSRPNDTRQEFVCPVSIREGKAQVAFANWYSRYMGPSLASALVSGNQADVDFWVDSGWPHNLFTFDGVSMNRSYPTDSANRYDMVMYLLSVYPSGANTDTYDREGFRTPEYDWSTISYMASDQNHLDGGSYHWAQMAPVLLAAEMAYHNGMSKVFALSDPMNPEPAALLTYKRAIKSRTELDRRPTSLTGHPDIGYAPYFWMAARRYDDSMVENALSAIRTSWITTEMPADVMQIFRYPRHIAWRSGDALAYPETAGRSLQSATSAGSP